MKAAGALWCEPLSNAIRGEPLATLRNRMSLFPSPSKSLAVEITGALPSRPAQWAVRTSPERISASPSSPSADWLAQIKCIKGQGFLIIGYGPSSVAGGGLGRLLLACREGDDLTHVGSVRTGFSETTARSIRKSHDAIRQRTTRGEADRLGRQSACHRGRITWMDRRRPASAASYKGLRESADAKEVFTR